MRLCLRSACSSYGYSTDDPNTPGLSEGAAEAEGQEEIYEHRMTVPNRALTRTQKVSTPFGSMYVHVLFDEYGSPCGGSISDPQKEPDAQIAKLVRALANGLNKAMGFGDAPPDAVRKAQNEPG